MRHATIPAGRRWTRALLGLGLLIGLLGMHGLAGPSPPAAHMGASSAASMPRHAPHDQATGAGSENRVGSLHDALGCGPGHGHCVAVLRSAIHLPAPADIAPATALAPHAVAPAIRGEARDARGPPQAVSITLLCICRT